MRETRETSHGDRGGDSDEGRPLRRGNGRRNPLREEPDLLRPRFALHHKAMR